MFKMTIGDSFRAAALYTLFGNSRKITLFENTSRKGIYNIVTNKDSYRLYLKYRSDKSYTRKSGYSSWQFIFPKIAEINKTENPLMVFICGVQGRFSGELVPLNKQEIKDIFDEHKNSITITRKDGEKDYRVFVGEGRDRSIQVKSSRLEEIFN